MLKVAIEEVKGHMYIIFLRNYRRNKSLHNCIKTHFLCANYRRISASSKCKPSVDNYAQHRFSGHCHVVCPLSTAIFLN